MKFSGVTCLAILVLLPLTLADRNATATKDIKVNSTTALEDVLNISSSVGRLMRSFSSGGCSKNSSSSGTGSTDLTGLTDIFSMFSSLFTNLTPDLSSIQLPDLSSLTTTGNPDQLGLMKFTALKIPAIFLLSVIVGVIAAVIVIWIPSKFQPDQLMHSMIDSVSNFMQQALTDVPAQYGIPQEMSQGYGQQQQGGYQQHQQGGYPQPDSGYSSSSGGYPAPSTSYGAPSSSYDASMAYQTIGAGAAGGGGVGAGGVGAGVGGAGGAIPASPDSSYAAPATSYNNNAPSNTYTDPSTSYGSPHRRYNSYPSLSSNYLRSEKSRK